MMLAINKGNLNFYGCDIEELPNNLIVRGNLHLEGTKINELPKGLEVKGSLFLNCHNNYKLPDDFNISGQVFNLTNAGVYAEDIYLLYKQDWKDQHGISKELEQKVFADYCNYIKEENLSSNDYSFEDYLFEFGFNNGEMYASYEEFLRNEFRDEAYITSLLNKYSK